MIHFIKLQLLDYENDTELRNKTSELRKFAAVFRLTLHSPDIPCKDTFLIELPEDQFDACELINAIHAYCYFHGVGHTLASESVSISFEDFVKSLDL